MSSRSGSFHRMQLTSPPPSKALLELQKQGLELSVSPPRNTLQPASNQASGRSTPSDRDKPLPLEPFEGKRRSSSVYSTDTTITNIIRMYGGCRELDDIPPLPTLHHPQAYRDTVAPLLVRRLSLNHSPSPTVKDAPREAVSISSLRSAAAYANAVSSNKTAPSFTEFSRQLQQRRNELVSPLSAGSADLHRQVAYDQLAPPSPQVSSVGQSVSLSQTPPLPDAMSGMISDTEDSDLLPPPLGLSSSSLPSPPFDDWEKPAEFDPARHHEPLGEQSQPHSSSGNWSQNWLEEGFANQSPASTPLELQPRKSFRLRKSSTEKERERVSSCAETKYPGLKRDGTERKTPRNSSARSSIQQSVSHLLRSLSRKGPSESIQSSEQEVPPRERQLAIPATPYQVYGAKVFSNKLQKKQQKEAQLAQRTRPRGKSVSLVTAYQNSQSQIVGVLEGAKRKLRRKSSQKRQRRLKESIIIVGPEETIRAVNATNQSAGDTEHSWI